MDLKLILIVVVVVGVLWFAMMGPGGYLPTYFQQQYFRQAYQPEKIELKEIGDFPGEYRIEGIPWISYEKAYCHSTALQMIAYKHGLKPSIGWLNFLMGFTYGAFYRGDPTGFMPYTDPIPGARVAAPYLGLKMRYLTTNDSDSFLNAVRFYLSRGYPVGIQLDAAMLWDEEGFFPHRELLVGYDKSGFHYFETIKEDRFIEEAEGLKITGRLLVKAVSKINKEFARPWRFALTIFEKGEKKEDLSEIWIRNGKLLVGSKQGPIASGAPAIKEFASKLKKVGGIKNLWALETMSYTRSDNAAFLKGYFAGDEQVEEAAILLQGAGEHYQEVLEKVTTGIEDEEEIEEVVALLSKAASLEEEAGRIFMSKGEASTRIEAES